MHAESLEHRYDVQVLTDVFPHLLKGFIILPVVSLCAARAYEAVAPDQEGVSGRWHIDFHCKVSFIIFALFLCANYVALFAFEWPWVEARGKNCEHFDIRDSAEKKLSDLNKEIEQPSHIAEKLQEPVCFALDHNPRRVNMDVKRHELVVFREVFYFTRS